MSRVDNEGQCATSSILVILPTWVGDFVMATPALRAIRNRFTDARITLLMHPNLRELVRGGDWMNECIEWPSDEATKRRSHEQIANCQLTIANSEARAEALSSNFEPRTSTFELTPQTWWELRHALRSRRFDWAILLPNSFRSAWIAWWSGAKRRIGYARDGRSFLLTDRIPVRNLRRLENRRSSAEECRSAHSSKLAIGNRQLAISVPIGTRLPVRPGRYTPMPLAEYYADLAKAIGCERPGDRLELFVTPDCEESIQDRLESLGLADRHPLIVISPGAKFGAAKCWMPERFAAVADRLIESENATVIITCGPGEESIARTIGGTMKQHGLVWDEPLLTLGELKSLIRRSDLLICNDAGPRHIAKAFDVPVVTVFGPTHPDWTATTYEKERIVRIDVDCGPCQQRLCPLGHHQCMTGVTVDMVFAAASDLLRSYATQHAESR